MPTSRWFNIHANQLLLMLWEWSAQYSYCGMQVLGTLASKAASLLMQSGRGHVWNCALTLQSIAQKWRSVNPSYILLAKASHIPRKSWNRISVNSSKWQPQELTMNLLIYKQVNSSQTFVFSLLTSINDVGNSSTSHPPTQHTRSVSILNLGSWRQFRGTTSYNVISCMSAN